MNANLGALRAALADLDYELGQAIDMLGEERLALTPAQADRADSLVDGSIMLAGIALERIEEAARGA